MNTNNVVVIAGGIWQQPLVEFLQRKGFRVHVVNPTRSTATSLADAHIQLDIFDIEGILDALKTIHPLFVTSDQSDVSCYSVARISEELGTPGNPLEAVTRFSTNKGRMYEFARSIGVPVEEFAIAKNAADVKSFFREHGPEIIIKPSDSTNSRGFHTLNDASKIDALFDKCSGFSRSKAIIVQKFCHGDAQLTLEGVCSGGRHRTVASCRKGGYWKPQLTRSCRWPSDIDQTLLESIYEANDKFVELSGLRFGITHGEYIIDTATNRFCLNEIACRGGGFRIGSDIIPWVSGVDSQEVLLSGLLGEAVNLDLPLVERSALLQFYDSETMRSSSAACAARASLLPGVLDLQYNFREGDFVADPHNPRHTFSIVLGEDANDLNHKTMNMERILCVR